MKVTEENVNSLFCNRVQYKIPLFQRHYVWDEEDQWKPLWNDIRGRSSQQGIHFTGTLVIQKENQSDDVVYTETSKIREICEICVKSQFRFADANLVFVGMVYGLPPRLRRVHR